MMDEALDLRARELKDAGEPFALATVVRTLNATAAKPGAKALVRRDGGIDIGWIGGGCVRAAIGRAAREALADGRPRLISLRPEELLAADGVAAGEERDGAVFARNGCPSEGSMDIFIEPVAPKPVVVIFGASPVADALAELAPHLGYDVDRSGASTTAPTDVSGRFVVVATQGAGDLDALRAALAASADYRAFVGSRRKFSKLAERLVGVDPNVLAAVSAPAGLNISAITPEEIALSILAEITAQRRGAQRSESA